MPSESKAGFWRLPTIRVCFGVKPILLRISTLGASLVRIRIGSRKIEIPVDEDEKEICLPLRTGKGFKLIRMRGLRTSDSLLWERGCLLLRIPALRGLPHGAKRRKRVRQLLAQSRNVLEDLPRQPLVSIICPLFNTPPRFLREMLESVINQVYPNWELVLVDDGSDDPAFQKELEQVAKRGEARVRIFREDKNRHICHASNRAIQEARGEWLALLDHDDVLSPLALVEMIRFLLENPVVDLAYSDEDKIAEDGSFFSPYFKPAWNRQLLFRQNYLCHFVMLRACLVDQVGGFREGTEGAQDWDLFLRISQAIGGEKIGHVPQILYHWRVHSDSTASTTGVKSYAVSAGLKAVADAYERVGQENSVGLICDHYVDREPSGPVQFAERSIFDPDVPVEEWTIFLWDPCQSIPEELPSRLSRFDDDRRIGAVGFRWEANGVVLPTIVSASPERKLFFPFAGIGVGEHGMGFRESLAQNAIAVCGGCLCVRSSALAEIKDRPPASFVSPDAVAIHLCLELNARKYEVVADMASRFQADSISRPLSIRRDEIEKLHDSYPEWFQADPFWNAGLARQDGHLRPREDVYPPLF